MKCLKNKKNNYLCTLNNCPDGGIGRRAGLKHQWIHFHAGSIPAPGTKSDDYQHSSLFAEPNAEPFDRN
jgi:hypothetical protein